MQMERTRLGRDYDNVTAEIEKASAMPDVALLTTEEAARFLLAMGVRISPLTLRVWRSTRSDGPKSRKIGRQVSYSVGDLRAYVQLVCSHAA